MERPSALQRLRAAFFASPLDGLITVVLLAALLAGGHALLHWLVFKAQWAVIQVNSTLFAVGRYPLDQQWRLWLLTTLLAGATGSSGVCCALCLAPIAVRFSGPPMTGWRWPC